MALRQFGELEAQVMDRVWRHNRPVLVRDILYAVNADRKLAYTTVLTVMERLCRKGWLRRQRQGRAYAYEAVASREHYTAQLMCDALATSSNRTVSFVHFLEQLSTEETRALWTALEVRQLLSDEVPGEVPGEASNGVADTSDVSDVSGTSGASDPVIDEGA